MSGKDYLNPAQFFERRKKKDEEELQAAKERHPANGDEASAQKRKDRKHD